MHGNPNRAPSFAATASSCCSRCCTMSKKNPTRLLADARSLSMAALIDDPQPPPPLLPHLDPSLHQLLWNGPCASLHIFYHPCAMIVAAALSPFLSRHAALARRGGQCIAHNAPLEATSHPHFRRLVLFVRFLTFCEKCLGLASLPRYSLSIPDPHHSLSAPSNP